MSYEVIIQPAAQRRIKKLAQAVQRDLIAAIEGLAVEPRPAHCKKLKGRSHQYRIRLGDYRIIYSVEDRVLIVRVLNVGHRRDEQ